jgi:hypothetical protein
MHQTDLHSVETVLPVAAQAASAASPRLDAPPHEVDARPLIPVADPRDSAAWAAAWIDLGGEG